MSLSCAVYPPHTLCWVSLRLLARLEENSKAPCLQQQQLQRGLLLHFDIHVHL